MILESQVTNYCLPLQKFSLDIIIILEDILSEYILSFLI